VRNRQQNTGIIHRYRIPSKFVKAGALACIFLVTLVVCHCSKTVDITYPDGEQGVSAYGTCVTCHSNEQMVEFTAKAIPPPSDEASEG
jgi:hypothetical protein